MKAAAKRQTPLMVLIFPSKARRAYRASVCALPAKIRFGQITGQLEQRSRRTDRSSTAERLLNY